MVLLKPPVCEFDKPIINFSLPGVDGKTHTLADCQGPNGTLVMFICNHCPYVKSIWSRLIEDVTTLKGLGVYTVAISANDANEYPEDSFENMKALANQHNLPFHYLYDESQAVAKAYGAVCTPDFFGYNAEGKLQYRGRLDDTGRDTPKPDAKHELLEAMKLVAETGRGPEKQVPSMGCSIKWIAE